MNSNEIENLKKRLYKLQDSPKNVIEITKAEAEYLCAIEDNSISMEDAIESHDIEPNDEKE